MIGAIQRTNEVRLPYPHPGQKTIRTQARRFNVLSAGRRWRKTTMAMSIVVEAALQGGTYVWGAPTFDQVRVGYNEAKTALRGVASFNQSRMEVELPRGKIIYRSLDNPDNARGHTADGVVIDEAGVVKGEAWHEILRPMLIDTNGWAWMIGTPKGRNWFFNEWHGAADNLEAISWQVPTLGVAIRDGELVRQPHPLENPNIPLEEIERLFETLPESIFRQEILAEFIEDSGSVFRGVLGCATATTQETAAKGHRYVMGVDWGKHNDFTVITVLDMTGEIPREVYKDRFNQIDYALQVGRLKAIYERFHAYSIIAERNSMGEPLIEQMQREGLPVVAFTTTNASKAQAIESLAMAFERSEIEILNEPVTIGELQAYQMERLPSGLLRYNAPPGMHDDTVMSLALAYASTWFNKRKIARARSRV